MKLFLYYVLVLHFDHLPDNPHLGLHHSVPEVWHARVLPDVAVRVPPDVGARPSPHIFVAVLEAARPRVLVTAVLTHSGLSIARGHLQQSTAQSKLQN